MLRSNNFKYITSIFLIVAIFLSSKLLAQEPASTVYTLSENAIANINIAIKSENNGLRKSAIYFVGKYSIDEASETLLEQLELEKDPSLRILITRVLYIINNDTFIEDIYRLASLDKNVKVRKMASAIHEAMRLERSLLIVDSNK